MHTLTAASDAIGPLQASGLLSRIRAEYVEMPGLSVTLEQAMRLWGVDRRQCLDALDALTREKFLYRAGDSYLRHDTRSSRRVEHPHALTSDVVPLEARDTWQDSTS